MQKKRNSLNQKQKFFWSRPSIIHKIAQEVIAKKLNLKHLLNLDLNDLFLIVEWCQIILGSGEWWMIEWEILCQIIKVPHFRCTTESRNKEWEISKIKVVQWMIEWEILCQIIKVPHFRCTMECRNKEWEISNIKGVQWVVNLENLW